MYKNVLLRDPNTKIGLLNRIINWFILLRRRLVVAKLFPALPWDNLPWGIDIWAGTDMPLQEWVDKYGLSFVIIKMGDGHQLASGDAYDPRNYVNPAFAKVVQLCYDTRNIWGTLGVPCMGYYVFRGDVVQEPDPNKPDSDFQYRIIKEAMKNKKPGISVQAIWLDFELKDNTNSNLSKMLRQLYNWISTNHEWDPIWRGVYTNMNMMNSVSPDSAIWIGRTAGEVPLWMAQWVFASGIRMTWEKLKSFWPSATAKCKAPGNATVTIWQIIGDGVGLFANALDFNVFMQSVSNFLNWLKDAGFNPRPVTPEPHTCPVGQHWDETTQACIPDVIPPSDDPTLQLVITKLDSVIAAQASQGTLIQKVWDKLDLHLR